MEIKTKYNIGDEVYYFNYHKALNKGIVKNIAISVDVDIVATKETISIHYSIGRDRVPSSNVFKNKEDALQEVLKRV